MAKKPRSQRRKKGTSVGGEEADSTSVTNKEFLSEEHTIADSITSVFDSEFGDDGKPDKS